LLDRPLASAQGRWHAREGLLLVLTDESGRRGLGEASPLPGYSRETVADCARALTDVHLRPAPDCAGLDALPAARFALETALLDLEGQRRALPLTECLSGAPARRVLPVNALVDASVALADLVPAVQALLARGYSTLKLKVGRADVPFEQELEALRTLRRAVGHAVALRLDANGAWTVEQARRHLDALAEIAPEFVEEPTRGAGLLSLGPTAVPWAADESLTDPALVDALLSAPGCRAVVLKPALLGLHAARALALRAQVRGLGVVVTHLFDGPVALAAACELALSLPVAPLACGLDPHAGLSAWPSVPVPQCAEAGFVRVSSAPGLGLSSESREVLGG
jgi:o-succinylbenzoate synthase